MLQTVSHSALKVLWACFKVVKIKTGMAALKAEIGGQLESNMEPISYIERKEDGTMEEKFLPSSGPGEERWSWVKEGTLNLTKAQAQHLRESYNKILSGEGFPAEQYKGVAEVEDLLTKWIADKVDSTEPVPAE